MQTKSDSEIPETPTEEKDLVGIASTDLLAVKGEAAVLALMLHYGFREYAPGHSDYDKSEHVIHCPTCRTWRVLRKWAIEIRHRMENSNNLTPR